MSSRSAGPGPEEPDRGGLTLSLWVLVVLLAVLELTWLWADRVYSS